MGCIEWVHGWAWDIIEITTYPQPLSLIKLSLHCCFLAESHHLNVHFNPCHVHVVVVNDAAAIPHQFSNNQLLNDRRTGIQVVTNKIFASDPVSIDISFTSGQVSVKCVFLKIMRVLEVWVSSF